MADKAPRTEHEIRIGTLVNRGQGSADYIKQILPHGFESFAPNFWKTIGDTDIPRMAADIMQVLDGSDATISCVGVYGNPLADDEEGKETLRGLEVLIDRASDFDCDMVSGFAGRVPGASVPESIPRFKEVWSALADRAGEKGVRIAFENCPMGGGWEGGGINIAFSPECWELMFEAVPQENVGLQWEPCHQMVALVDPMPQLREWLKRGRILNLHGKDATVRRGVLERTGLFGSETWAWHRTPGFGDSNWTDIITELRLAGFVGAIDIEGWHDPVYRDDLEMTGQVRGLNYLKECRGTAFVPNPA